MVGLSLHTILHLAFRAQNVRAWKSSVDFHCLQDKVQFPQWAIQGVVFCTLNLIFWLAMSPHESFSHVKLLLDPNVYYCFMPLLGLQGFPFSTLDYLEKAPDLPSEYEVRKAGLCNSSSLWTSQQTPCWAIIPFFIWALESCGTVTLDLCQKLQGRDNFCGGGLFQTCVSSGWGLEAAKFPGWISIGKLTASPCPRCQHCEGFCWGVPVFHSSTDS